MHRMLEDYIEILRSGGCFAFLNGPAKTAAQEILQACPEAGRLLSEEARQNLEKVFCARMETLYCPSLIEKVKEAEPSLTFAPSLASRENWVNAAARMRALLGPETGMALEEEYPLVREYIGRLRRNYIDSQAEMLRNIARYEKELSDRLFDGQPIGHIRSLSADLGDLHRHGRSVRRIVTDAGAFYYKPHDCRFEALYKKLVTDLFSDFTLCPEVICGDGFGFAEEMKPQELETAGQAAEYYRSLGMLLALFHAMGSTDMHGENIMACGVRPAAIDLETLVRGKVRLSAISGFYRQTPLDPVEEDMYYSVDPVGLLPNTIIKGAYMSALHQGQNNISVPRQSGTQLDIIGREEDFLQGFRDGYDRVLANRGRLLAMLEDGAGIPIRFVSRNTTYYFIMRSKLFGADAMASAEGRNAVLKRLEVPFTQQNRPVMKEMLDYEICCLSEGDIPYFSTTVDGHALCAEDPGHVLREGYWEMSPAQVMRRHLERLSPEERDFETAYIRSRLEHAPLPETEPAACPALPEEALTPEGARALCEEILRQLEQDSLRTASGARIWFSGLLAIEKDPSCGVFTHYADAALYCAAILSEPSLAALHEDAARIAEMCIRGIDAFILRLERESREYLYNTLPLGPAFGMGGILWAGAEAVRAGIPGAEAVLEHGLRLICENRLYYDSRKAGAEAGMALVLKALPDTWTSRSSVLQIINGCAEALLGREPTDMPMEEALRGAALSEAYRVSGEDRFRQAADAAFLRVRKAYLPHISGWADKKPVMTWLASSGGREGGIALCAMIAARVLPDGICAKVRDLALDALTAKQILARSDSLQDGNALSALALIRAASIPGRSGDLERAGRLLAGMVSRKEKSGCFICSPVGIRSFFDISACCGTPGIGYTAAAYLKKMEERT